MNFYNLQNITKISFLLFFSGFYNPGEAMLRTQNVPKFMTTLSEVTIEERIFVVVQKYLF